MNTALAGEVEVITGGGERQWSVDRRIPNLHASILHPEVGSFSHADEKPRLHHTWGGRDSQRSVGHFSYRSLGVGDISNIYDVSMYVVHAMY